MEDFDEDFLWNIDKIDRKSSTTSSEECNDIKKLPYDVNLFISFNEEYSNKDLVISVSEIKGNGVMDQIGTEVWEAAYILCSYLSKNGYNLNQTNQINLFQSRVLELGSGLGLPGLFIAEIMNRMSNNEDNNNDNNNKKEVCFSDYDDLLLNNLYNTICHQFHNQNISPSNINSNSIKLSIKCINWNSYFNNNNNNDINDISNHYDIIVGAALCYSPDHGKILASTLKYFLNGSCNEIIIIQIKDRPGFKSLVDNLIILNINFSLEEIDDIVYNSCNLISIITSIINNETEEECYITKSFLFPNSFLNKDNNINNNLDNLDNNSKKTKKKSLVTTPIDDFILLRISK